MWEEGDEWREGCGKRDVVRGRGVEGGMWGEEWREGCGERERSGGRDVVRGRGVEGGMW